MRIFLTDRLNEIDVHPLAGTNLGTTSTVNAKVYIADTNSEGNVVGTVKLAAGTQKIASGGSLIYYKAASGLILSATGIQTIKVYGGSALSSYTNNANFTDGTTVPALNVDSYIRLPFQLQVAFFTESLMSTGTTLSDIDFFMIPSGISFLDFWICGVFTGTTVA